MSWEDDVQELRRGGFPEEEISTYGERRLRELEEAGFSAAEVDKYFGVKTPDMSPTRDHFKSNLARVAASAPNPEPTTAPLPLAQPRPAAGILEAIEAGWQMSVSGLIKRQAAPDIQLPENAGMAYRIASQAATLAGDLPAMFGGALAGGAVGGLGGGAAGVEAPVLGPVTPIAGAITGGGVGASVGAFALPAAMRRILMDHYQKGDIKDFNDFWERASGTLLDTVREGTVGAATAVSGGLAKAALGPLGYGIGTAARYTGQAAAEIGTMVTVGKTLESLHHEGKISLPSAQDFAEAALLVGAMHVTTGAASHAWEWNTARKMQAVYAETGKGPAEQLAEAQADPRKQAALLSRDPNVAELVEIYGGPDEAPAAAPSAEQFQAEVTAAARRGVEDAYRAAGVEPPPAAAVEVSVPTDAPVEAARVAPEVRSADPDAVSVSEAIADPAVRVEEAVRGSKALEEADVLGFEPDEGLVEPEVRRPPKPPNEPDPSDYADPLVDFISGRDLPPGAALPPLRDSLPLRSEQAQRNRQPGSAKREADFNEADSTLPDRQGPQGDRYEAGDLDPQTSTPPKPRDPGRLTVEESGQVLSSKVNTEGNVPDTRSWRERFSDAWNSFYHDAYDRLNPVLAFESFLAGRKLSPSEAKAYFRMRTAGGISGIATVFLEHGAVRFGDQSVVGKSFRAILQAVENVNDFRLYAVAKRALEKAKQGIKTGIDYEAAKTWVEAHKDVYETHFRDLVDFSNNLSQYLIDAGVVGKDAAERFRADNQDFVPFYRLMEPAADQPGARRLRNPIHAMEGSERDVLDPFQSIIKNAHFYVALAEKNGAIAELKARAEAAGPEGKALFKKISPEDAPTAPRKKDVRVAEQLAEIGDIAIKPEKKNRAVQGENLSISDETLDALLPSKAKPGEISLLADGVRETYQVPEALAKAINETEAAPLGTVLNLLSAPARLSRVGVLAAPEFAVREFLRNPLAALALTQNQMTPLDMVRGFVEYMRPGADFHAWLAGGGANAAMVALDRSTLQQSVFELSRKTGMMDSAWNVVRHPLQALQALAQVSDSSIRLAEFKAARRAGKDVRTAAFESREIIPDAARHGAQMRVITSLVPFFHAQWQSLDILARAVKRDPLRVATVGAGMMAASALTWWLQHQDSRTKDLPDWQKDMFWVVPTDDWKQVDESNELAVEAALARPEDQRRIINDRVYVNEGVLLRFPKPFEMGVLFASSTERILEAYFGHNPDAMRGFGSAILGGALPSPIPAFAKPLVEQFANRSMFTGRPIVPASVERELPEYQYNDYTTATGKTLGKLVGFVPYIGKTSFASPLVIENYVSAWGGTLGRYALQLGDKFLTAAGVAPEQAKPLSTLSDIPFVRAFVVRHPTMDTNSVTQFYEANDRFQKLKYSIQARAREGNIEEAEKLQRLQLLEFGGLDLGQVQEALAAQSQMIRLVYRNPDMTPQEKRQQIDSLYYLIASIAREAKDELAKAQKIAAMEENPDEN